MRYEGIVIRPPSEAGSLILQATLGCSHNKCTFCPTYKSKRFKIRDLEEIREDISPLVGNRSVRRVFLADGDALIIPQRMLVPIVEEVVGAFPRLERIGAYANAKSVLKKLPEELAQLKEMGLGIVYLGLESGDPEVLFGIRKGVGTDAMIEAARRIREAGILLSVTVILGIAGTAGSARHAEATGIILSRMDPDYIGALTLMLVPGTPLYEAHRRGEFDLPDPKEILGELRLMLSCIDVTDALFTSNHASNYLPLRIRLPHEKEEALALIDRIIASDRTDLFRPEHLRGL